MSDTFFIKPRSRHLLDTGVVETDQPLLPFTGLDHSSSAMASAVGFWMNHDHPNWHEDSACKNMPQEIFYGDEDRSGKARHHPNLTVDEVARARRVCNNCPVQMNCLEWAIVNREEFGIWGGSTAGQRKRWIKAYEQSLNVVEMDPNTYDEVYGGSFEYEDDTEGDDALESVG